MRNLKVKIKLHKPKIFSFTLWFYTFTFYLLLCACYAQETKSDESKVEAIVVNGDVVEYSTDSREVSAVGNVSVEYKGTKLTCDKIRVNTLTKNGHAEGNVRLEDKKGVIEGSRMDYNFQDKKGLIIDSYFRSNPFFGRADKADKVSDMQFIAKGGYVGTCNYDNPHYRMKSKRMNVFPGEKIEIKDASVFVGQVPVFYLPAYEHTLKDPLAHVQLTPGTRKHWGRFLLTSWAYKLTESIRGNIFVDAREKLGIAEGFDSNYTSKNFGKGNFKYYYTQERDKTNEFGDDVDIPKVFQRYFIRLRHKWSSQNYRSNVIAEYFKIVDSKRAIRGSEYNILKDYFYREYEKDTQPLSYITVHHSFDYSTLDITFQKRINRWYSQLEKLPEAIYSLPSIQIGKTPLYFDNSSSLANYTYKNAVPSPSSDDTELVKFDTTNRVSLPMKVFFIQFNPFATYRGTYYDKDIYGSSTVLRTVFSSGADMSTKFYRIFNINSNFLGLNLNGLRHIITPTIEYAFVNEPTVPASKLNSLADGVSRSNSASLELSNKLQTKRGNATVDIVDFRANTSYIFKPKTGDKRGSNFSDFIFHLEVLPYSWLSFYGDTTYQHSNRSDESYGRFSNMNYDIGFHFNSERTINLGQRYQRKGARQFTFDMDWRLNPKWKFGAYQSYQLASVTGIKRGLREQEYYISRDLHCWIMELNYNEKKDTGNTIWVIFRLKAFPELEFNYNQQYHMPEPGPQSQQ